MNAKYRIALRMTTPGRIGKHKDFLHESIRRRTLSADTGHWVGEHRIVDRHGNRYYKRMIDTVTGEEYLQDHPLTDHQGHGSAKENPDT